MSGFDTERLKLDFETIINKGTSSTVCVVVILDQPRRHGVGAWSTELGIACRAEAPEVAPSRLAVSASGRRHTSGDADVFLLA